MLRIRRWVIALLVLGLTFGGGNGRADAAPSSPAPRQDAPAVAFLADGLTLTWRASLPDLARRADGRVAVTLLGYAQSNQPGAPQLPVTSELIVLPAGARPTVEIVQITERDLPLSGPLALAPYPAGVERDAAGNVMGGAFAESTEAPFLGTQGSAEQADGPVTLARLGTMRGVDLARITFAPVRPVADHLRTTTSIQVRLSFNAPLTATLSAPSDPLLDVLKRSVLNPEQVQPAPLSAARNLPLAPAWNGSPQALVSVGKPGLTAISYADLAAMGFPLAGVDPQGLRLSRAGVEIALQWQGDGDAVFEPDERLLFYADPRFSRWTDTDVYYLSVGDQFGEPPGLRMASRPANPAPQPAATVWLTQTVEINALYTPTCFCGPLPAGRDGDRWTWDDVRQPDRAAPAYPFGPLPGLDETQPATLTLWLISYTDLADIAPDHRVDVFLNGVGLGRLEWDGRQAITETFGAPPGVLAAGENVLSLHLPGVGSIVEGMWLDGFAVRYARGSAPVGSAVLFAGEDTPGAYSLGLAASAGLRGYDVTDPAAPIVLLGLNPEAIGVTDPVGGGVHRYFLAGEETIQSPAAMRLAAALPIVSGADYLIIAPAHFAPALADLIALRRSQGLQVAVADLQGIYDAFDGRPTPAAIHAYVQAAYATWNPRPAYLLLVGDGSYDPKLYRTDSKPTFLPPYLADVDPWMGETASDNRYALLDGSGDRLPDLLVGRLPVNSLAETQIVVAKIVGYESDPPPGGWNGNMLFVADVADEAGDFPAKSAALAAAFIQSPFTARPIYYAPPATTISEIQQAIFAAWNAGPGLIVYTGHSSVRQWAAARIFHRDDIAALHNGGRLPVVLEMSCFTGFFHDPSGTTLDESLLRAADGGAVAVWGATGLGVATGHQQLARGFLASLLERREGTLGAATLSGKLTLAASASGALDLVDTFTLLGDPATRPNLLLVPWANQVYLPVLQR